MDGDDWIEGGYNATGEQWIYGDSTDFEDEWYGYATGFYGED